MKKKLVIKKNTHNQRKYKTYAKTDLALSREMPDGTVSVIALDQFSFFYQIDGWAAKYWALLDGKSSQYEISTKLSKQSGYSSIVVQKKIQKIAELLEKERLLEEVN